MDFSLGMNIEFIIRLILAVLCGMAVGIERERKNQAAGLRTHIAVILGATLVMLLSKYGFTDIDIASKDPARLAAQVISGIGFLGAGMIIVNRNKVRGLTTAASLWTTACIGLAVGAGFYVPAIATTVLLVGTLSIMKLFESKNVKRGFKRMTVVVEDVEEFMESFESILRQNNIILEKIEKREYLGQDEETEGLMELDAYLHFPYNADISFLIVDIGRIKGVHKVEN